MGSDESKSEKMILSDSDLFYFFSPCGQKGKDVWFQLKLQKQFAKALII